MHIKLNSEEVKMAAREVRNIWNGNLAGCLDDVSGAREIVELCLNHNDMLVESGHVDLGGIRLRNIWQNRIACKGVHADMVAQVAAYIEAHFKLD